MNLRRGLPVAVAASLMFCTAAAANPLETPEQRFTEEKLALIQENLLFCLASEYPGVRATAALTLRQVKNAAPEHSFDECIIPLMRIVKSEKYDIASRITAALALHELRSARGDYAIKTTGWFTDVERLQRIYSALAFARDLEE